MKRPLLLLSLLALPALAQDPATNAPASFRATILGNRPAGPYLVSNRVARLRDTFGLSSPSGLRAAFDAMSAPEGAVAERSLREESGGKVSIRRERFVVPFSELPAEREFADGFRVRLEPADGPAAPPPAEADGSVFEEWHAALTSPAEPPPEGVSPAVYLARRQMDPFGPPDEFEFSLGYRNHPAQPEGTNVVWAGWLRSEKGTGFIEQSWPVRLNGRRLEIGHSVFWSGYRGGDLSLFELRSLPLDRLRHLSPEVPMTGCLLAISTDGSRPAVLDSDFPEEFRKDLASPDPALVQDARDLIKDMDDIQRSTAEETHAETAESPLAAALARGDWLPLVVESLFIDATAPRELRKNWVVSFSGGVKARVHSPVKTFCASVGEIPGKRFNVRFVDRAAATNALHGTIYSGELEVHPGAPVAVVPGLGPLLESVATASQRPVESEPPSPPSGPVAEKMKRVVLPIVDFRLSPITEVVAVLEDLARNHDDSIAAARGQGITFVLDIPSDATDSLPLVTCVMKSVSVYSALDMITEMSGLEWRVDGDVIRLTLAQRRPAANETHAEAEDGVDGGCFGHAPSAEN